MDIVPFIISGMYIIVGLFLAIALVFFIVKRLEDKKKEDFEKRDN
jgi:hypothetical protein